MKSSPPTGLTTRGFALIELLVVLFIIALLASLILPALAKAKSKSQGIVCLKNARQLHLAWVLYANENDDRLVYNLGVDNSPGAGGKVPSYNWVNNVLNWELDSDNTNAVLLQQSKLSFFMSRVIEPFRCPSDRVLSDIQRRAGWNHRIRSYSMNAMVGNAGSLSAGGTNVNNPVYTQFFKLADLPHPERIFIFVDEHPDSINDGYFVNRAHNDEWVDLPASYHNGAAAFSFGDGHAELHRWRFASTRRPPKPDAAQLPFPVPHEESADYKWILERMSVQR